MLDLYQTGQKYQEWAKVDKNDFPHHALRVPKGAKLYMAVGEDQRFYTAYREKGGPLKVVGLW